MRESRIPAAALQKDPVQRREEPCFGALFIAQLVPLGRPDIEGLLRQIKSIGFPPRQAKGKPVKRLVV
jgi:hypothetical protein